MRLSKIKLAGFKSFVDPTTINLSSNLTGIVGPNGCGKSNLIDAVRWVLGESSAKNLRGDSMTDVIFNGSTARKPIGQASIELIFDNSVPVISDFSYEVTDYSAGTYEITVIATVIDPDLPGDILGSQVETILLDGSELDLGSAIAPTTFIDDVATWVIGSSPLNNGTNLREFEITAVDFVGNEATPYREAVDTVRALAIDQPPSSPCFVLFQNGKVKFMLHRMDIEGHDAESIAKRLEEQLE